MFTKKEGLDKEIQKVEGEAISSIIDESMSITGEITFKGKTRIDGEVKGNIRGEHLILSKTGKINGDISVVSFMCHGSFTGNIDTKILTATRDCSINGKIVAGSLTVEPGACIEGEIKAASKTRATTSNEKETSAAPKPASPSTSRS